MIIVGVLLAASRFQERVQSKVLGFIETNFDSVAEQSLLTVQSEGGLSLTPEERAQVKVKIKPAIHKHLAEVLEEDRRRIKAWEVWLVVLGTFLNGFGDYVVVQLKPLIP